jgi:hypothetical protein
VEDIPEKVRTEYRELLAQGLADKWAAQKLIATWKTRLKTKAMTEQFWLALAGTQWQLGRLDAATQRKALRYLDATLKSKKARTKESQDGAAAQRRQALASLRQILMSKQPPKKEIPRHKAPSSDEFQWPVGEVFAYKLLSGRYVLFHVVARLGDASTGYWPVFALLDWIGTKPPNPAQIQSLPLKTDPDAAKAERVWMVSVLKRHPSDFMPERIAWLGVKRRPHAANIDRGFAITYWKEKLDEKLRFDFDWH